MQTVSESVGKKLSRSSAELKTTLSASLVPEVEVTLMLVVGEKTKESIPLNSTEKWYSTVNSFPRYPELTRKYLVMDSVISTTGQLVKVDAVLQ